MTDTPIADQARTGHHPAITPHSGPAAVLRQAADAIHANRLAARLLETGIGQRLNDADIDAVTRVALAIEQARGEIPPGHAHDPIA